MLSDCKMEPARTESSVRPVDDESPPSGVDGGAEIGASAPEPRRDPRGLVAVCEACEAVFQGERDGLDPDRPTIPESHEEEETQVVAQVTVGGVVVDEISEVVEHPVGDAVKDVGGVPGNQGSARTSELGGHATHVRYGFGDHVRPPVWGHHHDVSTEVADGFLEPGRDRPAEVDIGKPRGSRCQLRTRSGGP